MDGREGGQRRPRQCVPSPRLPDRASVEKKSRGLGLLSGEGCHKANSGTPFRFSSPALSGAREVLRLYACLNFRARHEALCENSSQGSLVALSLLLYDGEAPVTCPGDGGEGKASQIDGQIAFHDSRNVEG